MAKGYKQGATKNAVIDAIKRGLSIQQLIAEGNLNYDMIKGVELRNGIKMRSDSGKPVWGSVKTKFFSIDASTMTAYEAALAIDTSISTIYSMSTRYNINLKKAEYGSMTGVCLYGKASLNKTNQNG